MKLQHFCIIFLIIILPFSIMARNTTREYMLTLRDQTRLNNVIDNATQDALDMIVELNDEFQSLYFAQQFNISSRQLNRIVQKSLDKTVYNLINEAKIKLIKTLLLETDISLCDIALQCGYSSEYSLSRFFKQYVGWTPAAFRKNKK